MRHVAIVNVDRRHPNSVMPRRMLLLVFATSQVYHLLLHCILGPHALTASLSSALQGYRILGILTGRFGAHRFNWYVVILGDVRWQLRPNSSMVPRSAKETQEEDDTLGCRGGIGGAARQTEVSQGIRDWFGRAEQQAGVIRLAGGSGRQ